MIDNLIDPAFQPITNAKGDVFAYEALLRLQGAPQTTPQRMITRWERTGYIKLADLAMLRRVGQVLALTGSKPRIAVNVSIATIEEIGDEYVKTLIAIAPYARRLIVELTETATVNNASALLRFYTQCRERGFAIALDDCRPGHPYGDPYFIRKFKPQIVKIDGTYLQDCFSGNQINWLTRIIDVAHKNEASVIAEYVSSAELKAFAFRVGADYVQGFAIGRPGRLPIISGNRYSLPLVPPQFHNKRDSINATVTRSYDAKLITIRIP